MSIKNKLDQLKQVVGQYPELARYMGLFGQIEHELATQHYEVEALRSGVTLLHPDAVLRESANQLNRLESLTHAIHEAQGIINQALENDMHLQAHGAEILAQLENAPAPDNLQILVALKTIAEMPIPEQDNMVAANMRQVAQRALEGVMLDDDSEADDFSETELTGGIPAGEAVVIGAETDAGKSETAHLLDSEANAERLQESVDQLNNGEIAEQDFPVEEEPVDIAAILRGESQVTSEPTSRTEDEQFAPAEEPVETEAEVDQAVDELVGRDDSEELEETFDTIEVTDTMIGSRAVSAKCVSGHVNSHREFMLIRDGEQGDSLYRAKLFLNLNNRVMDHVSEGAEFIFEPEATAPNLQKGDVLVFM